MDKGVEAEAQTCTTRDPSIGRVKGERHTGHIAPPPGQLRAMLRGLLWAYRSSSAVGHFLRASMLVLPYGDHTAMCGNLIVTDKGKWGCNNWHSNLGRPSSFLQRQADVPISGFAHLESQDGLVRPGNAARGRSAWCGSLNKDLSQPWSRSASPPRQVAES